MYSSTLSSTSALDGALVVNAIPRPLYSWGKRPGTILYESGDVENFVPPPGFDPWTVQLVASSYTDWAVRAKDNGMYQVKRIWKSAILLRTSDFTSAVGRPVTLQPTPAPYRL